jgi:nucleoside phosphorylase
MIGILCPSVFEYKALDKKALKRSGAILIQSGMGKVRTLFAASQLKANTPHLKIMLLIGFAGSLKGLHVGDTVEPSHFIEQDYNAEPFERFPNQIKKNSQKKLLSHSLDAVMLTQDKFLTENPYKSGPYAKKFKRIACDMESYALAHYASKIKLRYHVIKLISDSADDSAAHDFLSACKKLSPKLNKTVLEAVRKLAK